MTETDEKQIQLRLGVFFFQGVRGDLICLVILFWNSALSVLIFPLRQSSAWGGLAGLNHTVGESGIILFEFHLFSQVTGLQLQHSNMCNCNGGISCQSLSSPELQALSACVFVCTMAGRQEIGCDSRKTLAQKSIFTLKTLSEGRLHQVSGCIWSFCFRGLVDLSFWWDVYCWLADTDRAANCSQVKGQDKEIWNRGKCWEGD